MLPEDDRMVETCRSIFKCFNVNFRLLKTTYVHLLVCYLNRDEVKFLRSPARNFYHVTKSNWFTLSA